MAVILCIETATTNCSVSLAIDGKTVAVKEENSSKYSHAEKLHVFIDHILKENESLREKINAIAVSVGPGSYTGLRIGVSAAKGLAFSLDVPVIALSTLEILAQQGSSEADFIIPMIDARRMEVYSAVFDSDKREINKTEAHVLTKDSYSTYLSKGKCVFLGDGSQKFQKIVSSENAVFFKDKFPSASDMSKLAENKYKIGDFEDVAYFEPFYLKEFTPGR